MKKERAMELLPTFPELEDKHRHQIETQFPDYIIYSTKRAVCTACGYEFDAGEISGLFDREPERCCDPRYQLSHKKTGLCPNCEKEVEYNGKQHLRETSKVLKHNWNYMVFLDFENRLYIRCFAVRQYLTREGVIFEYNEMQRYLFSDEGNVRYGPDEYQTRQVTYKGYTYQTKEKVALKEGDWAVRSALTEPVFQGYMFGSNSYNVINYGAFRNTCVRYSALDLWGVEIIIYLKFWFRHKNAEYLLKAGFKDIIKDHLKKHSYIDWKQNDLRKMMGVNAYELRLLKNQKNMDLKRYQSMRADHKNFSTDELYELFDIIGYNEGTFESCVRTSGQTEREIFKYMRRQRKKNPNLKIREYEDYLGECKTLKYDTKSSVVNQPRDLHEAHMRTSGILAELARKADEKKLIEMQKQNAESIKKRPQIPFADEKLGLFLRLPENTEDIIAEGKNLNHCVGGYAKRHNEGTLTIAFIRKINKPDASYYTVEIAKDGTVKQCKGKGNKSKTDKVNQFLDILKERLAEIYQSEKKTKKVRKSA